MNPALPQPATWFWVETLSFQPFVFAVPILEHQSLALCPWPKYWLLLIVGHWVGDDLSIAIVLPQLRGKQALTVISNPSIMPHMFLLLSCVLPSSCLWKLLLLQPLSVDPKAATLYHKNFAMKLYGDAQYLPIYHLWNIHAATSMAGVITASIQHL